MLRAVYLPLNSPQLLTFTHIVPSSQTCMRQANTEVARDGVPGSEILRAASTAIIASLSHSHPRPCGGVQAYIRSTSTA